MTWPLRSTPITGASSLLRASPPARPTSVLNPSQFPPVESLPLAVLAGRRYRGTPSPVPRESSRSDSRRLHAGHHLANKRAPARLIPEPLIRSGFDANRVCFDTSSANHLRSSFRSPPDASSAPFPTRSRPRSSAKATVGGLKPSPAGRLRRATILHLSRSTASRASAYIKAPSAFGTHTSANRPCGQGRSPRGLWNPRPPGPTAGPSACSDTEKPLPGTLVTPFRQTLQQRERSRLAARF